MRLRYILFLLASLFLGRSSAIAQMVGDNVFLQGAYVEVGVAPNGGYGTTHSAPSGYHANSPGDDFYDPLAATYGFIDSNLGFVADYGRDGWGVGTPPAFGDFFLPGTPQEGWAVEVGGVQSNAYVPAYESDPTTGFTGGLSGTNISYSNTGGVITGVWLGQDAIAGGGILSIRQTTTLDTSKLFFVVTVILTNTGPTTLSNIYYFRTVDPDNDETYSGSYTTDNTITYQLPDPGNRVLVSATGTMYTDAYLGLGTKDTRAKCMIFSSGLTPSYDLATLYTSLGSTGYTYTMGDEYTADVGIGLDYNIGTLVPGQCTYLTYAYILNATYIDSALNATETVSFEVGGASIDSTFTTVNACTTLPDTVGVNLINASDYSWSWSPNIYLRSDTGANNVIYIHEIPDTVAYTITGINIVGGCDTPHYYVTVYGGLAPAPVLGPVTYCQGSPSLPLPGAGTYQHWWSTADTATTPYTTVTPVPSTAVADTQIYYENDSIHFCRTHIAADTVVILPLPAAPVITEPTFYCYESRFIPFTTDSTSVLWYTVPTGGIGSTTPPTVNTGIPSSSYVFYASDTSVTAIYYDSTLRCESPRISYTVSVGPDSPIYIHTVTDPTYCGASDATIKIGDFAPFTPDTVTYVYNGTDTSTFPSETGADSNILLNGLPGGYYSAMLVKVGQCVYTVTGSVTLDSPVISAAFSTSISLGCHGDTVYFTNNSTSYLHGASIATSPYYYVWNFGDGSVSDTNASPYHVYQNQGTYTATLVTDDHLCWDTVSQSFTFNHPLYDSFTVTHPYICENVPDTFTNYSYGTLDSPVYYNWYFGNGATDTAANPVYTYPSAGSYVVTLVAHDYVPCYDTFTTTVYSDTTSSLSLSVSDTTICEGSAITFNGALPALGNTGITWYLGNGDSILNSNSVTYAYGAPNTYTVTAVAYYRACADDTATQVINVVSAPNINLGPDTSICSGSASITLADNVNSGNPAASWLWNTGQTTSAIVVNTAGTYYATVSINNCSASDSVVVSNGCYMDIPNAFTPNNDGVNDYFYPRQLLTRGLTTFKMDIYNRWGELIFETTSLDGVGWDGKLNNVAQPEGVYVYIIDGTFIDGEKEHHQGNVTLLR